MNVCRMLHHRHKNQIRVDVMPNADCVLKRGGCSGLILALDHVDGGFPLKP